MSGFLASRATQARVLVVHDEPGVLVVMRDALNDAGKRALTAESTAEAIAVVEESPIDLVVAGIGAADGSGLALLHGVRASQASLPVLLLIGDGGDAELEAAIDLGAAGLLARPFTMAELLDKVDQALQRQEQIEAEIRGRTVRPTIAMALANAIEVKDIGMEGHVERLGEIALAIGRQIRLSRFDLQSLELGALLHDIGKIGIPDSILLKPEELDAAEREIMKAHAVIGDQMLRHLDLDEIRPIVRHHHERWDGSGYPDGLAGDEIPRLARIVSVADSIEAMSARRPYRRPMPTSAIERELADGRGTQWDPLFVDLALELIASGSLAFITEDAPVVTRATALPGAA